jgi:hypothetical protein
MAIERPQIPVIPRPLHNRAGTIRALARQMLQDLDRNSLNTTIPTVTLQELLTTLCDALEGPTPPPPAVVNGALLETTDNPNLRYWVRRANQAMEDADDDGMPRQINMP